MKTTLGRAGKREAILAIQDVDKALAGVASSYRPVKIEPSASVQELKMARRALRATEKTFGLALGVDAQTVKDWESGERKPSKPATKLIRLLQSKPMLLSLLIKL